MNQSTNQNKNESARQDNESESIAEHDSHACSRLISDKKYDSPRQIYKKSKRTFSRLSKVCNEIISVRVWYLLLAEASDLDPIVFSGIEDERREVDDEKLKDAESQPHLGTRYSEEVIK